jgi:aminopeptidase-like protein
VLKKDMIADLNLDEIGYKLYDFVKVLYPICRSITGDGLRETLSLIGEHIATLEVHEVKTGTRVFDWIIPKEWNIKDAYIKDSNGNRVVDYRQHNLHVVSYSVPVDRSMSLTELKAHLHTLPEVPHLIPYRTAYYSESWGFCLSHDDLMELSEDEYEVKIDSVLSDGHLNYGECFLRGKQEDEVLFFCHICHPSLCNDNLSGISVLAYLFNSLSGQDLNYSYRFVFAPATIGSITWLAMNQTNTHKIKHGLVISNLGDSGCFHYKKSRNGKSVIDIAAINALRHSEHPFKILEFSPYGYDERQFCSPGFDLPMGRLTRSPNGEYPEYHTSGDNLDLVRPEFLADSLKTCLSIIDVLENNQTFINTNPYCEPQLGKRGLYRKMGGFQSIEDFQYALLWVLNQSDGRTSLLDISERAEIRFSTVRDAAMALSDCGLLKLA